MSFETEWARCAPWIEAALEYDPTHGIEDVRDAIVRGRARLWAGERSAIVTEINVWPKLKTGQVWLAGGDMSEMHEVFQPMIEAHFRAEGCKLSIITGRPGWARTAGYRPVAYSCVKELT